MASKVRTPSLDALVRHFAETNPEQAAGGNTPILLDNNEDAWLVASGKVDVFVVSLRSGQPTGARRHCLTVIAGEAIFGMPAARSGEGIGLLAVGAVGTHLIRLSPDKLQSAAFDESLRPRVLEIIARWVTGLSREAWKPSTPRPRAEIQLCPNSPAQLEDGERGRAQKEIVWVSHESGTSLFLGLEEISVNEPAAFVPLTRDTFIQAVGNVTLTSIDTEEIFSRRQCWKSLACFHSMFLSCQDFNARLSKADEFNRLRSKKVNDRRKLGEALGLLAKAFTRKQESPGLTSDDDTTVAAATLIGRRLGLTLRSPAKLPDGRTHPDPIAALAEASQIRVRKVLLKSDWWSEEPTPLLVFFEDDHRAVAILSKHGKPYLHDPTDGSITKVSEQLANRLEPVAFTFYRPLPDGPISPWKILRFSLEGTGPDLRRLVFFGALGGLLALLPPHFIGMLVGTVIPEASEYQLLQLTAILLVVIVTSVFLGLFQSLTMLRLEVRMGSSLQPAMWDRLLNLPIRFFRQHTAGDLMLRGSAIDQIRQVLTGAAMGTLMMGLFSVFFVGQLLYYSFRLGVIAIGFAFVALLVSSVAAYLKLRIERRVMATEGQLSSLVLQMLTGLAKLRVAGAESRTLAEWARRFSNQVKLSINSDRIDAVVGTILTGLPIVGSMGLFFSATVLTQQALDVGGPPPITVGTFVAFTTAFGILLSQVVQLGNTALSMLSVIPLYERAMPILTETKENDATKSSVSTLSGEVEVSHVSFRYHDDGPLILNDVSINIPAESYVAFVGPSGSGKSTLLRLMIGLESPSNGSIYYDGRDLSELDTQQLRRNCGIVIQNGRIREGSIYDNIVGSHPLTESDAWDAVRMAGFEEDIRAMPMGMHTVLQQGGGTLSGGQRQRLMIARAMVTRPRLFFFDEATSALDNRTQSIVTESLKDLQATRVTIAHRLSTIQDADNIYVLVAGQVVQFGPYDSLLSQQGHFSDLAKRQLL